MRILYIVGHNSIASGGGSAVAIQNLFSGMRKAPNVELYAIVTGEGDFTEWMRNAGITPIIVPNLIPALYPNERNRIKYIKRLLSLLYHDLLAVFKIARLIKKIQPDLVHTNNSVMVYGYLAARLARTTHVWHLREYIDLDYQYKVIPNLSVLKRLISHSYTISITNDVSRHFGCTNPHKDYVVFDGVIRHNEICYCPEKGDYFLFVGAVVETKGVSELIKAFSQYAKNNPKYRLLIAGHFREDYYSRQIEYIKSQGAEHRISFLGFRNDRFDLMSKAQALIVPSRYEAFGFITVEAMMNGCLIIGHNTAGTRLIMERAKDCELPFNTYDELVTRIEEVATNGTAYYKDRVLEAQRIANESYTVEQVCENTFRVYQTILKEDGFDRSA